MLTSVFSPLPLNAKPLWQAAQLSDVKIALPSAAAADSEAAPGRVGLGSNVVSEPTYAASASRSADRPVLRSPSGCERVPAAKSASAIRPLPPASARI